MVSFIKSTMKVNVYFFYLVLTLTSLLWSSCSDNKQKFHILVIHSYEEKLETYPEFNRLIAKEFKRKGINAEIRTCYLDCEYYLETEELARMRNMLDTAASWKPDLILVNDDQATYSLLKCRHPLTRQVPIVFAGVNYPNWTLIKQYPNVTGLYDKIDFKKNIDAIQKIRNKRVDIATILDSTFLDNKVIADIKQQLKGTYIKALNESLTIYEKGALRQKGYVMFSSKKGRNPGYEYIRELNLYPDNVCYLLTKRDYTTLGISKYIESPTFTTINDLFGGKETTLGGYMTPLPTQVKEEVEVAGRILKGGNPSNIPVKESKKQFVYDWKYLKKYQIPINRLPANSQILNIPLKERYPVLWWGSIIFIIVAFNAILLLLLYFYLREKTKKRNALQQLADEKETLALAVEGSDAYAWKLHNESFIFGKDFWNALGMSSKEISLESFSAFIHPDQLHQFKQYWQNRFITEKKILQLQLNFTGEEYQWWELRCSTSITESNAIKTTGLLLNIQKFKEREFELERARDIAEKAELKQSFLANVSHEIRTPLNAIVGFSNLLTSDLELSDEEKQDYIDTINRNSDILLNLINDILELSRLDSDQMSFNCENYSVSEIIDAVYSTHQLLIPKQLTFLKENCDSDIYIYADKSRLTQVLTNFLGNASKFTQSGYIKIGYTYDKTANKVHIFVEDTGEGISKEEQNIIFNRFAKLDEFAQGTGLGLAISKTIVEKLNGEIKLYSELGKGSRFEIVLPTV